jgi:VWFA-related protein
MATFRLWLAGLLILGLPSFAAPAQGPTPSPTAPSFGEALDVDLVNVDVFVTGRKGEPVTGLTAADFEVFEDGRRVEITNFSAVDEPRASLRAAGGGAPATAPGQAAAPPLYLAVLIDNYNLRPQNRARILSPLAEFLAARLEPADQVLVASFDQSVHVQQPFTADRDRIGAALDRVAELPATGWMAEAEERDGMLALQGWLSDEDTDCNLYVDTYMQQVVLPAKRRTELTLQAVEDFIASLGERPGRKALLYVTEGLQLRPGGSAAMVLQNACGDAFASLRSEAFDTAVALQRLTAVANAARVTLYPMGIAGVGDAQRGGAGAVVAAQDRQGSLDALSFLGTATGGKPLLDVIDVASALRPVLADAGTYYSLAYPSPRQEKGKIHDIRVKVRRRGAEVRYRRSYRDRTPEERILQRLLAALWEGGGDNPLGLELEVTARPSLEGADYRVPLRLGIPIDQLTLEPRDGERAGRVKVYVTVRGEGGSRTPVQQAELAIHVPAGDMEAASEQLYGYEINLTLGPGDHRLALAVLDEQGDRSSFLTRDLTVGTR